MPKRTLSDEQKKVRNEKARRRRALAFACRRVPIELEREIFSFMKNPDNGRVEVAMTWQKHPTARPFSMIDGDIWWFSRAGTHNLQTNVARLIERPMNKLYRHETYGLSNDVGLSGDITGMRLRKITTTFTLRMLRNIADKAIKMIDPADRPYSAPLIVWRHGLHCTRGRGYQSEAWEDAMISKMSSEDWERYYRMEFGNVIDAIDVPHLMSHSFPHWGGTTPHWVDASFIDSRLNMVAWSECRCPKF